MFLCLFFLPLQEGNFLLFEDHPLLVSLLQHVVSQN